MIQLIQHKPLKWFQRLFHLFLQNRCLSWCSKWSNVFKTTPMKPVRCFFRTRNLLTPCSKLWLLCVSLTPTMLSACCKRVPARPTWEWGHNTLRRRQHSHCQVTNHGQLPWVLDHKGRGLEIVLSLVFQNIDDLATLKTNEFCIATSRPGYGFAPHRSTDGKRWSRFTSDAGYTSTSDGSWSHGYRDASNYATAASCQTSTDDSWDGSVSSAFLF